MTYICEKLIKYRVFSLVIYLIGTIVALYKHDWKELSIGAIPTEQYTMCARTCRMDVCLVGIISNPHSTFYITDLTMIRVVPQ